MNQKVLKTLEYHKIIEKLTEYAASEPGKRLCRELEPSSDFEEIVQAQAETADAVARVRQKGSVSFAGISDIGGSLKRLEIGSSLSIHELLAVSSLLTCAARAKNYGRRQESELPDDSLDEMFRSLEPLTNVNNEITRCIISEEEVADDASPGLRHVRRQMKITGDRVHTQLNAILNSSRTMLQDPVITMRDGRYCLPVKAEYKSSFQGMVHDQSATGSTLFIEPMAIIKLNNELRELEIREQKEIEMVLAALSMELVPYVDIVAHYNRGLIQNRDHFSIMCFSEIWFIWAEAAHRKWISGTAKSYYDRAVAESVYEWNPDASESIVSSFLSNPLVSLDGLRDDAALERIMTQKWISTVLVGIEAWCDYRRTGYPEMPVKSLAGNDSVLPTRLLYPADEEFRNPVNYDEAVNGWLGGVNNMKTEVWWADHNQKRKKE